MSDSAPRDITTDHDTIREWVEQRDGMPAHSTERVDDDASSLYIVQEGEEMEHLEPISWDDFFETFEAEGLAFVYQNRDVGETDEWLYDLIDREEVAERATLDRSEVENALLEGEVVRSEITETTVIETTVVETDQVESQIVDSELIESNPIDREVVSREIVGVSFEAAPEQLTATLRSDPLDPMAGAADEYEASGDSPVDEPADTTPSDPPVERRSPDREEANRTATTDESALDEQPAVDTPSEESANGLAVGEEVVFDVHDIVRTTTEMFDRKTVESRIVEQEITEADTVARDEIDIEGIERSLLESDLISGEIVSDEPGDDERLGADTETTTQVGSLPSGAITSERTEGDAIESQFVERRLIETDSTEHHQLMCDIAEHQLIETVDSRSTVIERAIVDREAGEEAMLREPEAEVWTTDEQTTASEERTATETATAEADAEMAAEQSGETGESGATDYTADEPTETQALTEDEIGKPVVSGDKEVGIVSDVDAEIQTLYVDAEPTLTDRIKAALDWGDTDDDSYPVDAEQIEAITDDEIRIREL